MKTHAIRTPKGVVRVVATSRAEAIRAAWSAKVTCQRCHTGEYHTHAIMVGK